MATEGYQSPVSMSACGFLSEIFDVFLNHECVPSWNASGVHDLLSQQLACLSSPAEMAFKFPRQISRDDGSLLRNIHLHDLNFSA